MQFRKAQIDSKHAPEILDTVMTRKVTATVTVMSLLMNTNNSEICLKRCLRKLNTIYCVNMKLSLKK